MWPENWQTVRVFCALGTQWRCIAGLGGAAYQGLIYSAIPVALRMLGVPRVEWQAVFAGLQTMEAAALAVLNRRG